MYIISPEKLNVGMKLNSDLIPDISGKSISYLNIYRKYAELSLEKVIHYMMHKHQYIDSDEWYVTLDHKFAYKVNIHNYGAVKLYIVDKELTRDFIKKMYNIL